MRFTGVWILFFLFSCAIAGGDGEQKENIYVKTAVSLSHQTLRPGERGEILVAFTPIDGIHINVRPPVKIGVDAEKILSINGAIKQAVDANTGYLAPGMPVKQAFRLHSNAQSGEYSIKGTCTYFFCSDAEGWCTKFSQPIELTLTIMK